MWRMYAWENTQNIHIIGKCTEKFFETFVGGSIGEVAGKHLYTKNRRVSNACNSIQTTRRIVSWLLVANTRAFA